MKYLIANVPENTEKGYIGINFVAPVTDGVVYPRSFVIHLVDSLVCEVSEEFYSEFINNFLSDATFIDVSKYMDEDKAIIVNLNEALDEEDSFGEDFDEEDFTSENED